MDIPKEVLHVIAGASLVIAYQVLKDTDRLPDYEDYTFTDDWLKDVGISVASYSDPISKGILEEIEYQGKDGRVV